MQQAETIAINVLGWISSDPELFNRFVGISGIDVSQIRQAAEEPGFLAGVLEFIMNHEPTLLSYCAAENEKPENVASAFRSLSGTANPGY